MSRCAIVQQTPVFLDREGTLARAAIAKRVLEVTGHYAHPDIFTLWVDTRPQSPSLFQE